MRSLPNNILNTTSSLGSRSCWRMKHLRRSRGIGDRQHRLDDFQRPGQQIDPRTSRRGVHATQRSRDTKAVTRAALSGTSHTRGKRLRQRRKRSRAAASQASPYLADYGRRRRTHARRIPIGRARLFAQQHLHPAHGWYPREHATCWIPAAPLLSAQKPFRVYA